MKSLVFISQSVIQIFVGIGAFICGALFMLVPSGTIFQMSPEILQQSPFNDFFIPGIILLLVNGLGQLAAGMLTIRKHRLAGYAGAVFGIGLMIWIFVQVNMIGGGHLLQYSYFLLGVLETALAFLINNFQLLSSTKK